MLSLAAQVEPSDRVFVEQSAMSRTWGCFLKNEVVSAERNLELRKDPDCAAFLPEPDDTKGRSLLTYRMGGDCRISGNAEISVDRNNRTYTVHLSNYWGRCRAGGSLVGWLMVDEIPEGHEVRFIETKLDSRPDGLLAREHGSEILEIDLAGCIQLRLREQKIIRNRAEFLAAIREDSGEPACRKLADDLDLENHMLLGVSLNTGYCKKPRGLRRFLSEFGGSRLLVVDISYTPMVGVCRALSRYDMWLKLPLRKNYEILIRVQGKKFEARRD